VEARDPASGARRIADGVWLVRGGVPKHMNVYLIEDAGGGVTLFDAGIRAMAKALAKASAALGGVNRIVLGHSHPDHRGAAPALGAPVLCHPDERAWAEAGAPPAYVDARRLGRPARWVLPRLLAHWDGGPVRISDTVQEGDEVSGFRVVHLPGHAPGQIALHREADGLALVSDAFYTLDIETGFKGEPRVPHPYYTQDSEQARASLRKLAALDLAAAWPGHAEPVVGDVRGRLERVAAG